MAVRIVRGSSGRVPQGFRQNVTGAADAGGIMNPPPPLPDVGPDDQGPAGPSYTTGGAPDGMQAGWWAWAKRLLGTTALRSVQFYLPEVDQIPSSIAFQQIGQVTSTGVGTLAIPGTTLALAKGRKARIDSVSIFVAGVGGGTLAPTNQPSFSILVDGSPVPGWQRSTFGRVAVSVQESFSAFIRVPVGRVISATMTNSDGGTYIAGLYYTGWHWSESAGERWKQGVSDN